MEDELYWDTHVRYSFLRLRGINEPSERRVCVRLDCEFWVEPASPVDPRQVGPFKDLEEAKAVAIAIYRLGGFGPNT